MRDGQRVVDHQAGGPGAVLGWDHVRLATATWRVDGVGPGVLRHLWVGATGF